MSKLLLVGAGIVVAELIGGCLAFASGPVVLPQHRLFGLSSSPFIVSVPTIFKASARYTRATTHCNNDEVDEFSDDSGEAPKWNEITPELRQAGENFCFVTGSDPMEIQTLFDTLEEIDKLRETTFVHRLPRHSDVFQEWIETLLPWKDIKRGKDLFIPKMGSFDISKAYEFIAKGNKGRFNSMFKRIRRKSKIHWAQRPRLWNVTQRELVLQSALEKQEYDWRSLFDSKEDMMAFRVGSARLFVQPLPFWLASPSAVQTVGYFGDENQNTAFLLSQPGNYPQRQYLIKYYHHYFKQESWRGFLDELVRCGNQYPDDFFANFIRFPDYEQNYMQAWPLDQGVDEVGPPPQLFGRIQRLRDELWKLEWLDGNEEFYEHLYKLKDAEIGELRLVVLRSKFEIYQVGKKLHNCAVDYVPFVASKQGVLIKAENEGGRAVALGLYDFRQNEYDQIYGPRNEPVSENIIDAYKSYKETIREWSMFVRPID